MAGVLIAAIGIALVVFIAPIAKGTKRGKRLPGPPTVPIFGNVLQLPPRKVWEKLHEWGQTYGWFSSLSLLCLSLYRCDTGGIYSIRLFNTPCLVLNTVAAAREVLEGKSALYSNRPLPKIIELYVVMDVITHAPTITPLLVVDSTRALS